VRCGGFLRRGWRYSRCWCSLVGRVSAAPRQEPKEGRALETDSLVIRPVQRGDFPAWKPLWDGYNAFYGRKGETALPAEITQTTWSRFFDAYEPVHALVAESSGQLVGLAHFLYHRSTI